MFPFFTRHRGVRGCRSLLGSDASTPDPAATPAVHVSSDETPDPLPLWMLPADTTVESLDRLVEHLDHRFDSLSSNYTKPQDSPEQWKKYTETIPPFLESLEKRKEVTAARGVGTNSFLPVLVQVLGLVGSLHWAAFGFSMLAWGIENWDKKQQNFDDCLVILRDTIFLLKHTRLMWQQDQSIGSNELMQSNLPQVVELAFRASAIFASCSPHSSSKIKRCLKKLCTYIGAPSLEGTIRKVKEDITILLQKNGLLEDQQTRQQLDRIQDQTKPPIFMKKQLSGYLSLKDINLLGRSDLANEVEGILKTDMGHGIAAVCLHGMGGVGKSSLGLHIFNTLLKQELFTVYTRVEMQLDSEEKDLP